jgi:hypothetical protein
MNYKDIHMGSIIENAVIESEIGTSRICNFLNCSEDEIKKMYKSISIDSLILLKWSKLLEYDLFRIYTQHLILYAPVCTATKKSVSDKKISLPKFRKNIYTREVIDFILEQISTNEMTKEEVMQRYKIPKTTLYKWIEKYNSKS